MLVLQEACCERVLYAGVGGGEDAVMAARKGAHVTVIDLSPRMLAKASERIAAAGLEGQVECIRGDILEHDRHGYYDVVCANFFLNVFVEPVMREMMQYLVSLLRPGGMLLIADLAPVEGPIWQRMARRIYFGVAGSRSGCWPAAQTILSTITESTSTRQT